MKDYTKITGEEFDAILIEIIKEDAANVVWIPGLYDVLSEHYNNEILERYEHS